jgi:hypothetical protein
VTSWATTTGFAASVSTVQGDLRRIDALAQSSPALKTDCDVLVTDALSANENLPTPDETLTNLLSTAYSVAGSAGHDCFSGGARLLARSVTERVTARRDLIKSLAQYDAVTTA